MDVPSSHPDNETLMEAESAPRIDYPRPDGVLTFDRLSSVFISNTNHEENQPPHLHLADPELAITVNWERFRSPGGTLLSGRRLRDRRCRGGQSAAADQRAELRALQDVRHQGPDAEYRLGHAGGRRRARTTPAACEAAMVGAHEPVAVAAQIRMTCSRRLK